MSFPFQSLAPTSSTPPTFTHLTDLALPQQERNLHRNRVGGAFLLAGEAEPALVVLHIGFAGFGIFHQHVEGTDLDAGDAFFEAFRFVHNHGNINTLVG